MLTGHSSHQVGLDADIWLTPMPDRELTRREREEMSATMMVAAGPQGRRPQRLDAGAYRDHQGGRQGPDRRAHLRQRGDQEGALPRGRHRSRLALQGAALLWARLSFPRPRPMSGRQPRLQAAGSGAGGRSLRQGSRPLVHRRDAASEAAAAAECAAAVAAVAQDGRPAARLPAGAAGALTRNWEAARSTDASSLPGGTP